MRFAVLVACSLWLSCGGEVARLTGRPEGTISLRPGMSRSEAQRRSTMKINTYGDSERFFDFELAGEAIRFPGCVQYAISDDGRGTIESFSFASANEKWAALRRRLKDTEAMLLTHGWRYADGSRRLASLPTDDRKVARTDSGAFDAFRFVKGDLELTVTPYAKWGGRRPKVFWRSMNVSFAASRTP